MIFIAVEASMTGFELNDEEGKELEKYLDLDQKELKVYLGLLSLGNSATLGQISLITGYDIIVAGTALENLTHKGYVNHFKGNISRYIALEPFLENYSKLFDPIAFAGIIRKISKSLETTPLGLIDNLEMFNNYLSKTLTNKKKEILNNKTVTSEMESLFDESLKIISETAFSIIQDMEAKAKKVQMKASRNFQNETNAIFQAISDSREKLLSLLKISRGILSPPLFQHDILIGESSILISFRDCITRAKQSLMIFMPIPEVKSLITLIELSQRFDIKINVTGDIIKTPPSILDKIKTDGIGINLSQLEIDFWGVIMDEKELIFAPLPTNKEEEIVGIFTTYNPLIQEFSEQFRKFLMRAQPFQN